MVTVASLSLLLSGCESTDEEIAKLAEKNEAVETLYNKALSTFQEKKFKKSVEEFEEVERQHPYSEWAARAQVMAAYAAYRGGQFDDAVVILDRFMPARRMPIT